MRNGTQGVANIEELALLDILVACAIAGGRNQPGPAARPYAVARWIAGRAAISPAQRETFGKPSRVSGTTLFMRA